MPEDQQKPLGDILVREQLISADDLEELLLQQRRQEGTRLASFAARSGKVSDIQLVKALSEQHGVAGIDLSQIVIPLANLKLIPAHVAKENAILPILVKSDCIYLAMADPSDKHLIDDLEFATGRKIVPYVALHQNLSSVIEHAYRIAELGEKYYIGPFVPGDYLASLGLSRDKAVLQNDLESALDKATEEEHSQTVLRVDQLEMRVQRQSTPSADPAKVKQNPDQPQRGSESAPQRGSESAPQRARASVLIVDDEDDIRRLLATMLNEQGYRILEAKTGSDALRNLRSELPDAVILDATLPDIHGFDICRRMKSSERYKHIPIIMLSAQHRGWRMAADLRESYGVTEFIEKPFRVDTVVSALTQALAGQKDASDRVEKLSKEAESALEQGLEAYERGHIEQAIAHFQRGVHIEPLAFRLHYHLGLLYGLRGRVHDAICELETAVELQAANFFALKNLAVVYQRAGLRHKAVETWERSLVSAPDESTRQAIKNYLISLL